MAFPLASIKSDKQLAAAQEVMDRLLAKGELDEGEEMYLDALSDLVATYEDNTIPSLRPPMLTCCVISWQPKASLKPN